MSSPEITPPRSAEPALYAVARAVRTVLAPVASLKLTCALFVLAVLLIFFGTLAQKGMGIWTVVEQYFWSWFVRVDLQHLVEFGKIFFQFPSHWQTSSAFYMPGGFLIGLVMFVNLLAAHFVQFLNLVVSVGKEVGRKSPWSAVFLQMARKSGIYILHGGLLLLFVGEYITREFQVEQQMQIREGSSADYSFDTRNHELAFIRKVDPTTSRVTVVPSTRLREAVGGQRITHGELPVDVEVVKYMKNSDLADPTGENPATTGVGRTVMAVEQPEVSGVDVTNKADVPSAYVRLYRPGTDEVLGTYLVSAFFDRLQPVAVDGAEYEIQLRNTRYYKPFELHLIDFRFDRYIGTSTAKNYSSQVRLVDPGLNQDRELTISMNDPLRHRGETFYQSSFFPDEKGTILSVVRNPGWMLPYIACTLVTLGMLVHFGLYLSQFLDRRLSGRIGSVAKGPAPAPRRSPLELVGIPLASVLLAGVSVLLAVLPPSPGRLNLREAGRLPVVDGGRVKPLDTIARVNLRVITHAEQFTDESGKKQPAIKWFLDTASGTPNDPGPAAEYKIFRIEHDQVRDLLKLKPREGLRYSVNEMKGRFAEFDDAAKKARDRERAGKKDLELFEVKTLELRKHLEIFMEVWQGHAPMLLPPGDGREWRSPAAAREEAFEAARLRVREKMSALGLPADIGRLDDDQKRQVLTLFEETIAEEAARDPAAAAWQKALTAYRAGDAETFNAAVAELHREAAKTVPPEDLDRVRFEAFLNESALFFNCLVMYAVAIIGCILGWVALLFSVPVGNAVRRATFWWLVVTFLVHTFTLLSRMYLMDRPLVFVTNLYSSAVFIGWAATAICLVVELIYPISVGNLVAAVLGFTTSIIAHNLAVSGDTLEMMQAVLDTNFWLATHVTTVTMGYSATFIAGAVALVYVGIAMLPPHFLLKRPITLGSGRQMELGRVIGQIIYGIVCFATLLSFVGTVLGGIWADQSWGRFWGWDPKENGAVLIVLWNALILHARWAGLVKDRGMAVLALVGNMITTWSWFGTNQLGVGLHAYGFSNTLAFGCMVAWVLHLFPIAAGLLPWGLLWKDAVPVAPVRR